MPLTTVYLGLGSNSQRERHLCAGLDALDALLQDLQCSPVFESAPVGIVSAPFYNLVVCGQTDLPLAELDRQLKAIEAANGRYAGNRQPRELPLDVDVLLYGALCGEFDGLTLPRAEVLKNAFVLWPLALLAPQLVCPGTPQCFAALWQQSAIDQQLRPAAFEWRGRALTPASLLQRD